MSQELELAGQVQRAVTRNITDFQRILSISADAHVKRYTALQAKKPAWSREQLIKSLIAKPANRSARLGGAAGGVAFLPGVGTGLSVAGVGASTLKLLESCLETIDLVAISHGFDLRNANRRDCARITVLHMCTPEKARVMLSPRPPRSSRELEYFTDGDFDSLFGASRDILYRWGVAVASWRLSAAAPFGIGAFMGAWTSYAPVKLSARNAEVFFNSGRYGATPRNDDYLEDLLDGE